MYSQLWLHSHLTRHAAHTLPREERGMSISSPALVAIPAS